jgi:hypothetical protein
MNESSMLSLRKELFWDFDFEKLDAGKHKRIIIERVLTLGNLAELMCILKYYDTSTMIGVIKEIGYLDPKTLSFVTSFFNIDKNSLKCFTKKQSTETHWN